LPVRSVIAPPQAAQKQMPVSSVGPLTTRGAVIAGTTALEKLLNGLELRGLDDRRHRHLDHVGLGLVLACLPELGVEAVAAHIGRARQHLVDRVHAPTPAVPGADAGGVEMGRDRLDAHRSGASVALARQAEDLSHGLGLDWVDLESFLGPMSALLGRLDNPIADRRQRAVPEALAGILLHGP